MAWDHGWLRNHLIAAPDVHLRQRITVGSATGKNALNGLLMKTENMRLTDVLDLVDRHQLGNVVELLDTVCGLNAALLCWSADERN
ncbi:MAG: hypothetical protein GY811_20145 [Myxococcales bacterium]|nr:hypothetical protein [Myxococcales bacterium]